jgi:capsular polysaccharide transport system permease protein
MHIARSPLAVTASVWKALFLREALSRLFSRRAMWFWLLAEPIFHVTYLVVLLTVISLRHIGGVDVALWVMVGLLAFFMFRRTASQVSRAIGANLALFTYRQVKPIDTLLVRGLLEGFLMIIITTVLLTCAALAGHSVWPADPLAVVEAFFGLWLVGMGFGLVTSVASELVPEFDRVLNMVMMPIYVVSGVMFPLASIPQPYRDWLLLNPVAHGLEAARLGFASSYHAVPGLSISYIYGFALVSIFLGLALQRRFAARLVTQ